MAVGRKGVWQSSCYLVKLFHCSTLPLPTSNDPTTPLLCSTTDLCSSNMQLFTAALLLRFELGALGGGGRVCGAVRTDHALSLPRWVGALVFFPPSHMYIPFNLYNTSRQIDLRLKGC